MKLLDVNLLLYAINRDAPLHLQARPWLERLLSGRETVALTWTVVLAFLRLSTRPQIFQRPLATDEAFEMVASWLQQPCIIMLEPGQRHLQIMRELLEPLGLAGNLTSDAHLAAVALEHGAELCSCDTDFARFPGLRWTHPFAGAR